MQGQIPESVYVAFTVATAVGVLLQAGILLGFFIAFLQIRKRLETILTQVTNHALPLVEHSKLLLEDLGPKVSTISANLVEVSELLKQESQSIKSSVDEVVQKTRAQTARVDEMVSGTLDGLHEASAAIQQGIEGPLRQIHGIFNGVKASFATLRGKPTPQAGPAAAAATVAEEPVVVVVVSEPDQTPVTVEDVVATPPKP